MYFLGTAAIKGFAITLLLGILLSMFTSLVVTRFFVKWYLPLNSTKAKRLHLKGEAISAIGAENVIANDAVTENSEEESEASSQTIVGGEANE